MEYELDIGLPAPPTHTKVFLFSRHTRDFTERERVLLDLLQPHLVSLYAAARNRRVVAALEAAEHAPRWLVVSGSDGLIDFAGRDAQELLRRYFGSDSDRRLPDAVTDWFRQESTRLDGDDMLGVHTRTAAVARLPGRPET